MVAERLRRDLKGSERQLADAGEQASRLHSQLSWAQSERQRLECSLEQASQAHRALSDAHAALAAAHGDAKAQAARALADARAEAAAARDEARQAAARARDDAQAAALALQQAEVAREREAAGRAAVAGEAHALSVKLQATREELESRRAEVAGRADDLDQAREALRDLQLRLRQQARTHVLFSFLCLSAHTGPARADPLPASQGDAARLSRFHSCARCSLPWPRGTPACRHVWHRALVMVVMVVVGGGWCAQAAQHEQATEALRAELGARERELAVAQGAARRHERAAADRAAELQQLRERHHQEQLALRTELAEREGRLAALLPDAAAAAAGAAAPSGRGAHPSHASPAEQREAWSPTGSVRSAGVAPRHCHTSLSVHARQPLGPALELFGQQQQQAQGVGAPPFWQQAHRQVHQQQELSQEGGEMSITSFLTAALPHVTSASAALLASGGGGQGASS